MRDALGDGYLLGAVEGQQGAGMAHVKFAGHQQFLHWCAQLQQAQQIGSGGA